MEKNNFMIQMDFFNVNRQAEQLDVIATKLLQAKNKLNQVREKIPTAWSGDNADAYLKKMEMQINETGRIATSLQKVAEVVRGVAKQTYEAENEALERVNNRFDTGGGGGR